MRSESVAQTGIAPRATMLASAPTHSICVRDSPTESLVPYASAQTVKIVLTEAIRAPATTRRTSAQCSRRSTRSGSLGTPSLAACWVKAGVSWRVRRMT